MMTLLICVFVGLGAGLAEEAKALKGWINTPFSSAALESERDQILNELQNPIKGEFETTAAFEQRQRDANARTVAIRKEYEQKIKDAGSAYDAQMAALRLRLQAVLASSREVVELSGTLGAYNADAQSFKVSTRDKSFDIVVPLDKAPIVKQDFANYKLKVSRQLNENLGWDYLEAVLEGSQGKFASTDKAPARIQGGSGLAMIPPDLKATYTFKEPSGNNMLDAEESAELTITITNSGKGNANMLQANISPAASDGISYPSSLYFGEIKAGQSLTRTLAIKASDTITDRRVDIKLSYTEQNGFPPDDKQISFNAKALQIPDLQIADIGIEDYNKNGKIEPGEPVSITIRIQNRGPGLARKVNCNIISGKDVFLGAGGKESHNLGDLEPGQYKDASFDIITSKTATALDIKLSISEERPRFAKLNQALNLSFNRIERTADAMVIAGKDSGSQKIMDAPSLNIDIEQNIPVLQKASQKRFGVIFGIENYKNVSKVRFAARDAEYMKQYFIKVLGIPAENIYVRINEDASLSEMKTVFEPKGWLERNAAGKDNEIFVYYSGHGAPDPAGKKAFLIPYDGNPNYASISGYDLETLYANLQKLGSKHVTVFLDSCFSGANRENEIILADARPIFVNPQMPKTAANLSIFAASGGSQISSSYSEMQHGLFSYFLMKGLRGDADANKDKKISNKELQDYLASNVRRIAARLGREQDPSLSSQNESGVLVQW